ncbi:MAG: DUF5702 domain-containing protein [Eubacteriales bacterium]|nr:DUF5702 domain-containing protein [Eubacteriales bacterium]
MRKFCVRDRGAISVFLTLILVPVLIFCGVIVDASRLFASKTVISGAGDLAMNAALAQYDKDLKDDYGLMAMAKTPDSPSVIAGLEQYFRESCNSSYLKNESKEGLRSMIQLELSGNNFLAKGVEGSSLAETGVLEQQIMEYMKFRGPVYIVDEIIEKFRNLPLSNMDKKQDYVKKKSDYASKATELGEPMMNAKNSVDAQEGAVSRVLQYFDEAGDWTDTYRDKSVFWLAAKSLERYLNGQTAASLGHGNELTIEEVQEYLSYEVNWSEDNTELDADTYNKMVILLALYQSRDSLSSQITVDNGFSAEEVNVFQGIKTTVSRNINVMLRINDRFAKEYTDNLSKIESAADDIIRNGNEAIKQLDKVKAKWKKVQKAKEAYEDSKAELAAAGEEVSGLEDQEENIEINEQDLDALKESLNVNIQTAQNVKTQIKELKKVPGNLKKLQVSESESELLLDLYPSSAISQFWENHQSEIWSGGDLSIAFSSPVNTKFYQEQLADIDSGAEREEDKAKQKEQRDEAKHAQDNYSEFLKTIENAQNEKNLKNDSGNGMNYPEDFPSGVVKASPSAGTAAGTVDVGDDKKNVEESANNIDLVTSIVNGLDDLGGRMLEQAYLMEYITEMFNCLTTKADEKALSGDKLSGHFIYNGEMEYILFGHAGTAGNKTRSVAQLFALRLAIDSVYVFLDKNLNMEAGAVAQGIAAVTGQMWLYPVVKYGYLFCRALALAGGEVMQLVSGEEAKVWPGNEKIKLSYKEYLKIFILLDLMDESKKRDLVARTGDCIQLNIQEPLKNKYTMLSLSAQVKSSTTFWPRVPEFLGRTGEASDGRKTLRYQGILAY